MPATSPPNLLFLFPDQLGARWTALDGHPLVHTPRLLELAQESTVFTQACSSSPLCTPWRACLLSGRWPTQTGVTRNGQALPDGIPTLAQRLNGAGYHTAWLGKWHLSGAPQANRRVLPDAARRLSALRRLGESSRRSLARPVVDGRVVRSAAAGRPRDRRPDRHCAGVAAAAAATFLPLRLVSGATSALRAAAGVSGALRGSRPDVRAQRRPRGLVPYAAVGRGL